MKTLVAQDSNFKNLGTLRANSLATAVTRANHIKPVTWWYRLITEDGEVVVSKETKTSRLQQFWNWGHNCLVMGLSEAEAFEVLEDNGFSKKSMRREELEHFIDGFTSNLLLWARDKLKPVNVRPALSRYTGQVCRSIDLASWSKYGNI